MCVCVCVHVYVYMCTEELKRVECLAVLYVREPEEQKAGINNAVV